MTRTRAWPACRKSFSRSSGHAFQTASRPRHSPHCVADSLPEGLGSGALATAFIATGVRPQASPARTRAAEEPRPEYSPFPQHEPGKARQFYRRVVAWAFQSAYIAFKRLPKWVRILITLWIVIAVMSRGCTRPGEG